MCSSDLAAALFALQRYGSFMDIYEQAILVLAAPTFALLGWHWKPVRWLIPLIAVLSLNGLHDVRAANAMKNILATVVSIATIAVFSARSAVSWPETLTMLGGAVVGGYCGGRLVRVLPPAVVRRVIIGVGVLMTVVYAVKYWF